MNEDRSSMLPVLLEQLRLLRWNERVQRGDFVPDGRQGFELWQGPTGFRADAFVKQVYRRLGRRAAKVRNES